MAREISLDYTAGANLYAVVKTSTGSYLNGATPEAFNPANWASYAIALTEYSPATGQYWADFPAPASGAYRVEVYARAGASPAPADGPAIAAGQMQWGGAAEVALAAPVPVTVALNLDKSGYGLAATGLDAISVADPGPVTSQATFPRKMVALWRHFFAKTALVKTGTGTGTLTDYADDGTTATATRALTDDGTTQTVGAAT